MRAQWERQSTWLRGGHGIRETPHGRGGPSTGRHEMVGGGESAMKGRGRHTRGGTGPGVGRGQGVVSRRESLGRRFVLTLRMPQKESVFHGELWKLFKRGMGG